MSLQIPNLPLINKQNPYVAEALQKVQTYVTANVVPVAGNKRTPPSGFVNPSKPTV